MNVTFWICMAVLALCGIGAQFILFTQERDGEKNTNFLLSEHLWVFLVEILVAIIGFGVTLNIANSNEQQVEKTKALQMIEQTIHYMDKQIEDERSYLRMYNKGEITAEGLLLSSVVNTEYYEGILTNELILQNANMKIQGDIMRYLIWVEQKSMRAQEATDEDTMYALMYDRYGCFIKIRNLLSTTYSQLNGTITAAEAEERWLKIRALSEEEAVQSYENGKTNQQTDKTTS